MWGISWGGFTLDPGREAPPAPPPGHPADVRHRRPLPRRRPRPRRLRHRQREEPVRGQPAGHERHAAAPGLPGRGLARRVARTPGAHPAVAVRLDPGAGRRPVLAARLARAGLRGARLCRLPGRRLERLVRRCRVPDAGAMHGRAAKDPGRQLGPLVPGRRLPGPEPGLAPRDGPLLRPVPEGHRQRLGAGARPDLVRARVGRARAVPRGVAGPVAGGGRLPRPRDDDRRAAPGRRPAGRRHAGPTPRQPAGCVPSATARPPGPPAPSPGARAGIRMAWPGTSAPTRPAAPPGRAGRWPRRSTIIGVPAAVLHLSATMPVATCVVRLSEVSPDGRLGPRGDRRAQPHAPPLGHGSGAAGTGAHRGGHGPAARHGLPVLDRPPHPSHRPHRLLAGALALAAARHPARPPRTGHAVPARPAGPARGRRHPGAGRRSSWPVLACATSAGARRSRPSGGSRRT